MKSIFYFLVVGTLFITSCSSNSENNESVATASTEQPVEQEAETTEATTNNSESTQYPFPIYTSFDQFEPWLHRKSDTTYVVNFWATWCKPCVAELPYFEQLHEAYKDEKVKVVLVSLDFPKQIDKKLVPFIEKHQLQSEVVVLLDGKYNNWIDKVDTSWEGSIPITIIYNNENRKFIGDQFHDFEDLESSLKAVM